MTQRGIKPDSVKIRDRVLAICSHGDCRSNRIWDFETCWLHLTDAEKLKLRERLSAALRSGTDLKKIVLTDANLEGFDFTGADLSETFFNSCNLKGCKFIETNLRYAFFGGANLLGADLERAELNGAVFSGANLEGVNLLAISISYGRVPINIRMENFGKQSLRQRPHINERNPNIAEATYRALKAYFSTDGHYDSASWASYCERLMQRKVLWQRKSFFRWSTSLLFGIICGYGEKPYRSFIVSFVIVVLYSLFYYAFNSVIQTGITATVTWWDILAFSAATFCTISFPDLVPKADFVTRLLVSSEAFLGIFAFGLFIFTLTKRFVAR